MRKTIIFVIKLIVILAAYWFAWNRLNQSTDWSTIAKYVATINSSSYIFILLISVLMFINWSLEAIKWKFVIRKTEKLSFYKSFAAVWSGVTVGTITPNRIGEFAGRILFLKPENRKVATTQTLYGDLAQFITTIIFGIVGISAFFGTDLSSVDFKLSQTSVYLISGFALVTSILVYFYFNPIFNKLSKIKVLKKIALGFIPPAAINSSEKFTILALSILRYAVFSFQFFLAIKALNIEISLIECLTATSAMFLAVHIFPNIAVAEPGLRISFSAIFFGAFTDKISGVAIASLLIYFINVLIPIIFGGINMLFSGRNKC